MRTRMLRYRPRTLSRVLAVLVAGLLLGLAAPATASAYQPVNVVHTERVQAGPYGLTVGFSVWPVRAMKSMDFVFMPDGGIAGKAGFVQVKGPGMNGARPLVRHPRRHDVWGMDTIALNNPGTYTFGFLIKGPQGTGQGLIPPFRVLNQPGPPLPLSWTICSVPLFGLVALLAVAWRRTRPGRHPLTV